MAIQHESLEKLFHKDPFQPFRIVTTSGKDYVVNDPALIVLMRAEVFYAFPARDRWTLIPLSRVSSVEVDRAA